jgi:restriction system protein
MLPEPLNTILFIAAGILLIAAWIFTNYRRSRRMRNKALGMTTNDLLDLPPAEFEEMTAELYRALGNQAQRTGTRGDHGVDVVVKLKDSQKLIVQCKRWRKPVGEKIVRDFYGTMQHEKASYGTIIATSGFTTQAREWAKGKPISLRDGSDFLNEWEKAVKKREQQPTES